MVSTRGHPKAFPEPTLSASSTPAASTRSSGPASPTSPSSAVATRRNTSSSSANWSHSPSNLTLLWFAISLPLVIWDTAFVLLRPYTLPGGVLHSPLWSPYALYGTIDFVYSTKAWRNKFGFTGAQAAMNALETLCYFAYLYIVLAHGKEVKAKGRGAPKKAARLGSLQHLTNARSVSGSYAAWAALTAYSAAVMTVSKTLLYWLVQYYSDWADIGHNDLFTLIFLWIIPNGAWIVLPSYMIYVYGAEIIHALSIAAGEHKKRS